MTLFHPQGVDFTPVSPSLTKVRMLVTSINSVIAVAVPLIVAVFTWQVPVLPYVMLALAAAALIAWIWRLILIPRQVRAHQYYEGETELYIKKGIMFKSMTVVPYGRLQFVDLYEGPILRAFGIANVKLHTASAGSDAEIYGVPRAEADRLRRQLTERGESLMAGL